MKAALGKNFKDYLNLKENTHFSLKRDRNLVTVWTGSFMKEEQKIEEQ